MERKVERLMSRTDVDREYGISVRFLEISAMRGDGPPMVKIGRLARYLPSDLEAWIEARTVTPNGKGVENV